MNRVDVPDAPPHGTADALLRVHRAGDVARTYVGESLVADQSHAGRTTG